MVVFKLTADQAAVVLASFQNWKGGGGI